VRLLNVGSGTDESVLEIVELVATQLGVEPTIEHRPTRNTDVPVVRLCIERLQSIIDFAPRSVAAGLSIQASVPQ
jgi:UDP-glucose 4-epimerase